MIKSKFKVGDRVRFRMHTCLKVDHLCLVVDVKLVSTRAGMYWIYKLIGSDAFYDENRLELDRFASSKVGKAIRSD